jgi:two-component system cell cycle response regulator DivK
LTLTRVPRGANAVGAASVLVVDDNRDGREMLSEYLSSSGFVVDTAVDGCEAVEMALRLHPSAIVMDLMMPRMGGWEATRHLKADARTRKIPIIVMTANAQSDERQVAREAGCAGFILKPCDLDQVAAMLRRVIEQRGRSGVGKALRRPIA